MSGYSRMVDAEKRRVVLEGMQAEIAAAEARVRELEEALAWIANNTTEAHIHHSAAALVPANEETAE